jgi:hypothetical protein
MAKRNGKYIRTTEGIFNLDSFKDIFNTKIIDNNFVIFRIDNPKITFEAFEQDKDLFNFIKFDTDIIEVRELGQLVRYTKVKDIHSENELLTNEGVVHVRDIVAILIYQDMTDSYVRYAIIG